MTAIETHSSLEGYFRDLVQAALRAERVELTDASTAYLVQMMADFTLRNSLHFGEKDGEGGTPALFRLYEQAVTSGPGQQLNAYRHLGDVALFVSGFFGPQLERSLVSVDYYVGMGGSAYSRASSLDRSGMLAPLLSQLAGSFNRLVEVFTRVAEQTTLPVARDVVSLYERWIRNPSSEALNKRLACAGAIPLLPEGAA